MKDPIRLPELDPVAIAQLDELYRNTRNVHLRTRAQMILLAAEKGLVADEIAQIVRTWLKRYLAEGIQGLHDAPRAGGPPKVTPAYREQLAQVVRQRPRSLGQPYSMWTLQRLADYMAEQTGSGWKPKPCGCT